MSSMPFCTLSYSGMPFMETHTTATIKSGAMIQRMDASPTSMVRVMKIPPSSMMGARIPIVWLDWIKLCRL